jgi:spore maturation protein CgeB
MNKKSKPLRILVVLPLYGGSLPIGRFCARGLSDLGHLVETFEAPAFNAAYNALDDLRVSSQKHQYLQNSFLQMLSNAVLAKVETFEPDMVLCMAQAPLSQQALKRLRRDKVTTAMWFVEDYKIFTYWQSFAPLYDIFAVIQKEPLTSALKEIGVQNSIYLPLAAQPDFHFPFSLSAEDNKIYGADVSFLGAGYPNRRLAFRKLIHHGLKIWGTEWDGDHVLEPYVQLGGRRISSEECVKIYNATKINLNLHSSVETDKLVSGGDFINPRTFELAACGAFQLVDRRQLMPEAFAADELAVFDSLEELDHKIEYYLNHKDERELTARKGRMRVLKDHTYAARMQKLIDFTAARIPGWPKVRDEKEIFGPDFPEELRSEVLELLDKLGLSPAIGFDDLVKAIRQQQGALSSLDTSILFLDEWRKQYSK